MSKKRIRKLSTALIVSLFVAAFGIADANGQNAPRRPGEDSQQGACLRVERFGKPRAISLDNHVVRLAANGEPVLVPTNGATVAGDELWDERFKPNGANGQVLALARDGSGNIYAGGYFTAIGTVAANYIAMWDGTDWHPLGDGTDDAVRTIAIGTSSDVYVGGEFQNAGGLPSPVNYMARWNGSTWFDLDGGVGDVVNALVFHGSTLYAGGRFRTAGTLPGLVEYIASWNSSAWSRIGSISAFGTDGFVNALAIGNGDTLFVGGTFTNVSSGNIPAPNIAKFKGIWEPVGEGLNAAVNALIADGSTLYAGGSFTRSGGTTCVLCTTLTRIASWNGSDWSALAGGMNSTVSALTIDSEGDLVAGGLFVEADGLSAPSIARWGGSSWSAVGTGMDTSVKALAAGAAGELFAGGGFLEAGGLITNHLARWTGTAWEGMADGMGVFGGPDGSINAIATNGSGDVYVGGNFDAVGGVASNNIAMWDGTVWSRVGPGLSNTVEALAVAPNGDLYAGGQFDQTGDFILDLYFIGRWSAGQWWQLNDGLDFGMYGHVYALAVDPVTGNLYAGGDFPQAASTAVDYVAMWDVSLNSWLDFAGGTNAPVLALAIDPIGDVYVAGSFSEVGSAPSTASNVAKWDGGSWDNLDGGVNGSVLALISDYNGEIYAGGSFTTAGTPAVTVNHVAKWNGAWSSLGSGVNDQVSALAKTPGGDLFVGGSFTTAEGGGANHIARWNGAWSAMGAGLDDNVLAIGIGSLYAGGSFRMAGNKPSVHFAQWNGEILGVELTRFDAVADGSTARLLWETASEHENSGFAIQHSRALSDGWTERAFVPGSGGIGPHYYEFEISDLAAGKHFFRLKQIDTDGDSNLSVEVEVSIGDVAPFVLAPPFPNPARSGSTLKLSVSTDQEAQINLLDILGREVRTVFTGLLTAGTPREIYVDTSALAPGSYLVQIDGERFGVTEDIVVIK